ncbi:MULTISPECIES: hypothetical protein [Arthrospira]|uniref:hypothetical protein n=1 Tax=Oscillatoriales TaxID=1150 RepID=UPI0001D0EBF0|nr:hypothetical protein [Arthrospira platensis]MBD2710374.1 hypothetical protein [Arthrospira platensis FACHB-835]MDF2212614.1 hypothetical protein [Arthrospira platensis NCB002]QQW31627.1 hypothetical protein AP9108_14890 [Arthrospira sp. PCC 9108]BAI90936.1 hypothetical protein NIES39_H00100 [Arthrospira platensis NIES-39]MBD2573334.1 hypothetical protein [Arthrospira platensis FACHB-971]
MNTPINWRLAEDFVGISPDEETSHQLKSCLGVSLQYVIAGLVVIMRSHFVGSE